MGPWPAGGGLGMGMVLRGPVAAASLVVMLMVVLLVETPEEGEAGEPQRSLCSALMVWSMKWPPRQGRGGEEM